MLLEAGYDSSADIWSIACMVWAALVVGFGARVLSPVFRLHDMAQHYAGRWGRAFVLCVLPNLVCLSCMVRVGQLHSGRDGRALCLCSFAQDSWRELQVRLWRRYGPLTGGT